RLVSDWSSDVCSSDLIVFDTKARPDREELKTLAEGCDLLVIPTTPDAMSIEALMGTVDMLQSIGGLRYKILITIIPPYPERDGEVGKAAWRGREQDTA